MSSRRKRWERPDLFIGNRLVLDDEDDHVNTVENEIGSSPQRRRRCRWEIPQTYSFPHPPGNSVIHPQPERDIDTVQPNMIDITFHVDCGNNIDNRDDTAANDGIFGEDLCITDENVEQLASGEGQTAEAGIEIHPSSNEVGIESPSSQGSSTGHESINRYTSTPTSTRSSDNEMVVYESTAASQEYKRLSAFLYTAEISNISQRTIERLLTSEPIRSKVSYRSLLSFAQKTSLLHKSFVTMCPQGHCASAGKLRSILQCPICQKPIKGAGSSKFWFLKTSTAISALCRRKESYSEIIKGLKRARDACSGLENDKESHDYFNGKLFQRLHGPQISGWDESKETIPVFVSLSTDGFECAKTRKGDPITAWPVVGNVLNFNLKQRSRASNSILFAVIPGTHHSEYFDTFMYDFVQDLRALQNGMEIICFDNRPRTLKVHVLFFTSDWPAGSKVLGFVGHTGRLFCRLCHKEKVYVRNLKCSCVISDTPLSLQQNLIQGRHSYRVGDIINYECPQPRTTKEIKATWKKLEDSCCTAADKKSISKKTGIKRGSCLRSLSLDFKYSFPYDVMHLVLLGWTKQLLKLLVGGHARHERLASLPKYCISSSILRNIDQDLAAASPGIPTSWGRSPLPLRDLNRFKAEDLKRHAELYTMPYFHTYHPEFDTLRIWKLTSSLVTICFGFKCSPDVVNELRKIVEELYTRFVAQFCMSQEDSYCLTPTTHAILHLPELLSECGPLPITSQFLVERLLGEIGRRVQSKSNLPSHLFHKNHKLLAIRIMNDGMAPQNEFERDLYLSSPTAPSSLSNNESLFSNPLERRYARVHGEGKNMVLSRRVQTYLQGYICENLDHSAYPYEVKATKQFHLCSVFNESNEFSIETKEWFDRRTHNNSHARQKYYIAAEFITVEEAHNSGRESLELSQSRSAPNLKKDLYYGNVKKIVEVCVQTSMRDEPFYVIFAEVQWQYGLIHNKELDLVYSEGAGRRRTTYEPIHCIQRVVGYLDTRGRRYILDKKRGSTITCGLATLRGVGSEDVIRS